MRKKLTPLLLRRIYAMKKEGLSAGIISIRTGFSLQTIQRIPKK